MRGNIQRKPLEVSGLQINKPWNTDFVWLASNVRRAALWQAGFVSPA